MTAPAIDVRGLVKRYGNRTVVDHVDLEIMPGRIEVRAERSTETAESTRATAQPRT